MQNSRKYDPAAEKVVFATKIEDIIGGITLAAGDFVEGDIVPAGTLVGKDGNNLYHALKTAKMYANATNVATDYQVVKGHGFKVGDFFASAVGAKAYAITAINKSNAAYDILTLGTTIGVALTAGQAVFQALAESATTTSAFKVQPLAITGHTVEIVANDTNVVDAYLRASVFEVNCPPVTTAMKTLVPQILFL